MNKIERIKTLVKELNQHSYNYYTLDNPTISDTSYDKLYDELVQLEKETNIILSNSATQRVGYEIKKELSKITHKYPLKSLDKTKDVNVLSKFLKGKYGILMLKLDGLTNELVYVDGKLVESSSRGNGEIGESILHNVKTYANIPLEIPCKDEVRIIGEAIITYDTFDKINVNKEYKNPRNLVAGSVRQLDANMCKQREVKFVSYNVYDKDFESKHEQLKWLKSQGFDIVDYFTISPSDDLQIESGYLRKMAEDLRIPIDGLVLTFEDLKYAKTLSSTNHHPLHSIAYKFLEDVEIAILEDIQWQIGRTGVLTPVAIFSPVELAGTTVTRASVHNLSILKELKLGLHDEICIIKANDIIPQIKDNLTQSNTIQIPTHCPSCNEPISIKADGEAEFLICNNPNCKAKLVQKISHYVGRDCMNIDGLSDMILTRLIDNGFINSITDLYKLEQYKKEIIKLDGFQAKSYSNMVASINKSKHCKLENFIFSLGIPQTGRGTSKILSKHFKTIEAFLDALSRGCNLSYLDDIGEITSQALLDWWMPTETTELVCELLTYLEFETSITTSTENSPIKDLAFVVTGEVKHFKNRKELEAEILRLGGKLNSAVSSKTDYLINSDITSPSSKNQKAKQLNIPIITEDDFLAMIK